MSDLQSALSRLSGSADFSVFTEWLRSEHAEIVSDLTKASDADDLLRFQGELRRLTKVIDQIDGAVAITSRPKRKPGLRI